MHLVDELRICLLALESRYPKHVVSVNTDLLGLQYCGADCWSADEMIAYLEEVAPNLLDELACLIIDIQQSNIYLVNRSERVPALIVHCQGHIPAHRSTRPLMGRFTGGPLILPLSFYDSGTTL